MDISVQTPNSLEKDEEDYISPRNSPSKVAAEKNMEVSGETNFWAAG